MLRSSHANMCLNATWNNIHMTSSQHLSFPSWYLYEYSLLCAQLNLARVQQAMRHTHLGKCLWKTLKYACMAIIQQFPHKLVQFLVNAEKRILVFMEDTTLSDHTQF